MPKYTVTQNMGASLRNLRISKKVKAIEVAKAINKTGAYISKLENGVLNYIQQTDLFNIIDFLSQTEEEKQQSLSLLLHDTTMLFTKEESENEEWKLNLDYFYRKFPIPTEYQKFVIDKMKELSISIEELVSYANSNFDLYNNELFTKDLLDNAEKNYWYFNNGNSFLVVQLVCDDIKHVLYDKNISTNYSMLKCLLISIFRIEGYNHDEAYSKAHEILVNMNIQTLSEKEEIMDSYEKINEMHTILDQRNNENLPEPDRKLLTNLYEFTQQINMFAQIYDVNYSNKKIAMLLDNLKEDPILLMGLIGIDLKPLKNCDIQIKKEFLRALTDLISNYSVKKPESQLQDLL